MPDSVPTRPASTRSASTRSESTRSTLYSALVGVAALGVLLQGLWAGLFIHEGRDYAEGWVGVHSVGASVTVLLAVAATVVALVRLRRRRDLVVGTIAFTVLLIVEMIFGFLVHPVPTLTAVHIPLAMILMGMAVWLPLRARQG